MSFLDILEWEGFKWLFLIEVLEGMIHKEVLGLTIVQLIWEHVMENVILERSVIRFHKGLTCIEEEGKTLRSSAYWKFKKWRQTTFTELDKIIGIEAAWVHFVAQNFMYLYVLFCFVFIVWL